MFSNVALFGSLVVKNDNDAMVSLPVLIFIAVSRKTVVFRVDDKKF